MYLAEWRLGQLCRALKAGDEKIGDVEGWRAGREERGGVGVWGFREQGILGWGAGVVGGAYGFLFLLHSRSFRKQGFWHGVFRNIVLLSGTFGGQITLS